MLTKHRLRYRMTDFIVIFVYFEKVNLLSVAYYSERLKRLKKQY